MPTGQPSFVRNIQPLLRKYCGGCHNEADKEGDFSVATYASLSLGTPNHKVIAPGDGAHSRILQLMRGSLEPHMPPKDEAQPSKAEIDTLELWIAQGAVNDANTVPLNEQIQPPLLAADSSADGYITALIDVTPSIVALARLGRCELRDSTTQQVLFQVDDLPGKINQLRTSFDGNFLIIAGGIAGVGGQVTIVDIQRRKVVGRVQGHTDAIYCAAMSHDNQVLCTGSYDRSAVLWDWKNNQPLRQFTGHNGAIYDLDIDSSDKVLATASADQTVKLWAIKDGNRLDTLGQPEGEMLCVRFTPDGKRVIASGADKQLRIWQLVSKEQPSISPLVVSRFAHEQDVTHFEFRGQDKIFTLSEDHTVKLWQLPELVPLGIIKQCKDVPVGIARLRTDSPQVLVADFSGEISAVTIASTSLASLPTPSTTVSELLAAATTPPGESALPSEPTGEAEPNNQLTVAQRIELPAKISGCIEHLEDSADVDLFAFDARKGRPWVFEIVAARDKSPLDSMIDVLDEHGQPVLRTRLQAVRQSYFTFRGKDSNTSDDFRMHKWQEMELNELLYAGGEVVKLWLYPRGPDSGFKVYPGYGNRYTYFDTTPAAHALGEQAYIVKELELGAEPLPNGLPVFPLYFQNDDDAQRRVGKDSRLTFVAPRDGKYMLRVRDARGFGGPDYKYQLIARPQKPDFELEIKGGTMTVPSGSGREWQVTAKRLDGLQEPIEIHLEGVPEGVQATNPLIIEPGQDIAYGNIYVDAGAKLPDGQEKVEIALSAKSIVAGAEIKHSLTDKLSITVKDGSEVRLKLVDIANRDRELEELVIRPGETISARVLIDRQDQKGPISFGKEDAGRNLPHGSYVDNIGLNGLLITETANEREFFITAAKWLEPQVRTFHLRCDSKNNPTSKSIRLRIEPKQ